MPRPTKGPRLGGSPQHERHMLANLATQLFLHESIKTTEARARRLRPYAEKLITQTAQATFSMLILHPQAGKIQISGENLFTGDVATVDNANGAADFLEI